MYTDEDRKSKNRKKNVRKLRQKRKKLERMKSRYRTADLDKGQKADLKEEITDLRIEISERDLRIDRFDRQ